MARRSSITSGLGKYTLWREKNAAGWEGLQFPNWEPGFGVQNIYTLYIGDNVGEHNRSPF